MKIYEILESLDTQVDSTVLISNSWQYATSMTIGDHEIRFSAVNEGGSHWEVEFFKYSDGNRTYGKTGHGYQQAIFSFVIDSLKTFISIYKPGTVGFTSSRDDGNRSRLYKTLANKIKIPGYHLEQLGVDSPHTDFFQIVAD